MLQQITRELWRIPLREHHPVRVQVDGIGRKASGNACLGPGRSRVAAQ
ncbi:hypothetical protein RMSM_03895 [Rhodopirellula maiorica SM1]|uniref:Uncharacterized protein n=1 Tax=Rhodopirellula maiorica SM1 TaxID=1265738 RepID=M5RUV6_9BACT|nr:hypothetical protein RMSM_03895 [Rhodopirellula maiorica SM1]